MALAVVSHPTLSDDDLAWIQSVRREHDHLYFDVVDPHFTLVFPTDEVSETTLIEHVRRHAARSSSFDVALRCAILGDPDFQEYAHAFLVPDEGFSDVVRLHDRLYTGPLADELRLDIPFIPHVGAASVPTPEACKAIVDDLNAQEFEIHGRVETMSVVGYDGETVWAIEDVRLSKDSGE